jgi:hypothetical protein
MKRWILPFGYFAVIVLIIVLADRKDMAFVFGWIRERPGLDKICHFLLIGGLAFVVNYGLCGREMRIGKMSFLLGSVTVGILCLLEEVSQLFIPSRTFDLVDLTADFLGIWLIGRLAKHALKSTAHFTKADERH